MKNFFLYCKKFYICHNFVLMRRVVKVAFVYALAVCSILSVKAQSFEQKVAGKFFDYVANVRNEKIYVQTDRDSYQPGDTMFLRGFLFNATSNQQVDYSRYMYIEVVDRAGVLYWREKIAYNTQDSCFDGYFALSDNLSQGERCAFVRRSQAFLKLKCI